MRLSHITLLLSLLLALAQCKSTKKNTTPVDYSSQGYTKAIVRNLTGLDGCGFLLEISEGKKLEPTNLAEEIKKDRLIVWVKFTETKGKASVCMAGRIVTITDLKNTGELAPEDSSTPH